MGKLFLVGIFAYLKIAWLIYAIFILSTTNEDWMEAYLAGYLMVA